MLKVEYISEDNSESHLLEVKRNGSQYEMYVDSRLRGSTGNYEMLLDEIKELVGGLAKIMFDNHQA